MRFAPIGQVIEEPGMGGGMSVIDQLYSGYGEGAPRGRGPSQGTMGRSGNAYLKAEFANLDYIESARVCGESNVVDNATEYCK
jgi:peptidyl-prolyl cis-trans isomerase A (cyclophilin A)